MGAGVEEAESYAQQLEQFFRTESTGHRYEVINAGLAGANSLTAARRLGHYAGIYHPNLLVYGFTVNDI